MLLSTSTDVDRSFRYDPPSWARTWDDPKITLPTDAEFHEELRAYQAKITDPDLILFAVPTEEGGRTAIVSRLSTALGIGASTAAILYFFGHVIAAWAMGRL